MFSTDLEARLARDFDGALQRDLLARLGTARRGIRKALALPRRPDEYEQLRRLESACDDGMTALRKLGKRMRRLYPHAGLLDGFAN
jgi:type III secretion system YseE family protein